MEFITFTMQNGVCYESSNIYKKNTVHNYLVSAFSVVNIMNTKMKTYGIWEIIMVIYTIIKQ